MKVAFIGTYLPRKCGIATFTHDLRNSVAANCDGYDCQVIAIDDAVETYTYPPEIVFRVNEQSIGDYERAAKFLNQSGFDVVSLQHEFGIFGGREGSHIIAMLRALKIPVVTTLHTVLRNPSPEQRRIMETLIMLSQRLVIMTERGRDILLETYETPREKIDLIPHGIHDVPFEEPDRYKELLAVEGRQVLLTFGLLSPNKGIEHVIHALPEIILENPDVVYLVLGATHPHLVREHGEAYRNSLELLARNQGVEQNVIFYNRFVDQSELTDFIGAADVYITPYLNEEQIVSGTLAYAFGAGKAVVSTPYWHASELLANNNGVIVPFADSKALSREICLLLRDNPRRFAMRQNAYKIGRNMIWPRTAERYVGSFKKAVSSMPPKTRFSGFNKLRGR